jgi:hypothetical protein
MQVENLVNSNIHTHMPKRYFDWVSDLFRESDK